ncbi:hypothetical protein EV690_0063 [Celerinatantimonas diazotrophica]|uniref:Uncharacterized protein n=1 Tax=Celerinatantimonas diazotrophica TaxID=412034 RepID=A0A4R1KJZ5_9GAMM|nr:hypothetical protein EV690_0063 [Celerinatantimonas diazotrophica]CAG9297034.1 hypothetical protein CEDIAZO_02196 [Celerinatantimonas diazotrophica]
MCYEGKNSTKKQLYLKTLAAKELAINELWGSFSHALTRVS